jgi:hypothetical protein
MHVAVRVTQRHNLNLIPNTRLGQMGLYTNVRPVCDRSTLVRCQFSVALLQIVLPVTGTSPSTHFFIFLFIDHQKKVDSQVSDC